MITMKRGWTRRELCRDLRAIGLRAGDAVVVHSSMKSMGHVSRGPLEVVAALREVLTARGTLVMPAFSFNLTGWNMPPFDRWGTNSRVGLMTDLFWRTENVHRSNHPTHSVAAWGRLAREITAGAPDYEPLGVGSPLDRLRGLGGRILLIGVGQNRNSTVHVAESRAAMPYLSVPFTEDAAGDTAHYLADDAGEARELLIREMPGSSEGFHVLEEPLRALDLVQAGTVGAAPSLLMDSAPLCAAVEAMLRADPLLLLRSDEPSEITLRRRAFMEALLAAPTTTAPAAL